MNNKQLATFFIVIGIVLTITSWLMIDTGAEPVWMFITAGLAGIMMACVGVDLLKSSH